MDSGSDEEVLHHQEVKLRRGIEELKQGYLSIAEVSGPLM